MTLIYDIHSYQKHIPDLILQNRQITFSNTYNYPKIHFKLLTHVRQAWTS